MRVRPYKSVLAFIILLLSVGTASAAIGQEYQITNAPGKQIYAYIHENKIVYMSEESEDSSYYDILVYDLGPDGVYGTADDSNRTAAGVPIYDEFYPDIYGDLVPYAVGPGDYDHVYSEDANISLFNLETNATAIISDAPGYQCCPQIYNITVAWHDRRTSGNEFDVYIYDLGPDGVYGGGDDGGEFAVSNISGVNQEGPQIWGRNLVWTDGRNGNNDIYLYDAGPDGRFNTGDDRGEFQVTTDPAGQGAKDVREHMIVWADNRNGNFDIYGYDMGPDGIFNTTDDVGEFRVTDNTADQKAPRVSANIIVWRETRNGNPDVYIYDLGPDEIFNTIDDGGEIPLVTNTSGQHRIEMYDGKIVYDDKRDGDKDIYMFDLAPHITIDSPLNQTYTQTQIWANVTLNIDTSWCGYSLNGAGNQTMDNDSLSHFHANVPVPDGYNNLTFSCNGTVGFMSTKTVYFTVDALPPYVTNQDAPAYVFINRNWSINFTWIDDGTSVDAAWLVRNDTNETYYPIVDGNVYSWNNYNETQLGEITVTAYANDTNNNTNWTYFTYVVVNGTKIILDTPLEGHYYKANMTISGTVVALTTANVSYSLNNGSIVSFDNGTTDFSTWNDSTAPDQQNNLTVYAVSYNDASDNDTTSVSFYVDVTRPNITYSPGTTTNGTYPRDWIFVNVSVSDNMYLDTVILAVTGGPSSGNYTISNNSGTDYWINQSLDDGTYTFRVYANDLATNTNSTPPRTITLDTTGPVINITSPTSWPPYNGDTINLNYTANEPMNWTGVSFDGGANQTGGNQTFTDIITGAHTITVYANDSLGNMGYSSVTFTMSNSKVGNYNNDSVTLPANQTVTVTAIGSSSTVGNVGAALDINVLADVNGSINFTRYSESPTIPLNSSFLVGDDVALDLFIEIEESDNIKGNLSWAVVRVYYNTSDINLNGGGIGTGDISESTLKLYWYDSANGSWHRLTAGANYTEYGGPYVINAGVTTTPESGYLGYVWANVTSLSVYGVGGSLIPAPVIPRVTGGGGPPPPKTVFAHAILTTSEDWHYAMMAAGFAAAHKYILIATPTHSIDLPTRNNIKWFDEMLILGNDLAISKRMEDEFAELRRTLVPGFAKLNTSRVDGVDFFDTAVQLAKQWKDPKGMIVVRGDVFADALVAGQLSAATDSPILFTMPGEMWSSTLEVIESKELDVTIVGGEKAVSKEVEDAIRATGVNVRRIGGGDRYETAALVGDEYIKAAKKKGKSIDTITFLSGKKGEWASTLGLRSYVYNSTILYVNEVEGQSAVPAYTKDFIAAHPYISSASIVINNGAKPKGYEDVDAYIRDMQFEVDPEVHTWEMDVDIDKKDYALDTNPVSLSTTVSQVVRESLIDLGVLYGQAGGGVGGGGGGGDGGDGDEDVC